jgi:hypothetical protein
VLSKLENISVRIPLLKGEGAAKRRVRGTEKHLFTPHLALRATLSLQERDSRNIFQFGQHSSPHAGNSGKQHTLILEESGFLIGRAWTV